MRPVEDLSSKNWQTTGFISDGDDLSLPVSIYLDSSEGQREVIQTVGEVLQAYGFTNFRRIEQAPGSVFVSIKVTYKKDDRQEALKNKKKLKEDLLGRKPPSDPRRRRAVSKLKRSIWQRARRKAGTILVSGSVFLGTVTGEVFKDEIKTGIEKWLEGHGPKIVKKLDTVVAKDLPPGVAKSFHEAVKEYVDKSPGKESLEPPPPPK